MSATLKHATREIDNSIFFALLEQELAERGSVRFRVKGISMEPMLRNNHDEVQLVPYHGEELTARDICLFKYHGRHVLHRFKYCDHGQFYFQGDNVLVNYEYCHREDIVGVVKMIYRDGVALQPFSEEWKRRIKIHRLKQRIRWSISSCVPQQVKQLIKKLF